MQFAVPPPQDINTAYASLTFSIHDSDGLTTKSILQTPLGVFGAHAGSSPGPPPPMCQLPSPRPHRQRLFTSSPSEYGRVAAGTAPTGVAGPSAHSLSRPPTNLPLPPPVIRTAAEAPRTVASTLVRMITSHAFVGPYSEYHLVRFFQETYVTIVAHT
jgi:hypothetical protein